ncbi:tol-pal system protein YbgF [uncultured Roseobacter sp.]|uniref:tol-pal system protein YbgF n=1 Tax=uncultured Roseobacter sp. TaxID=114847 RepID=UPI002630C318|nr:tol-pal system protein YbgF [uncultured Roseobacter sp.]
MRRFAAIALCVCLLPTWGAAQDNAETLADIRQELTVLFVEMQKLRRELSTTGAPTVQTGGETVLERVAVIEREMQRLTSKTEELEFRINRIVEDGTNRIGDLEFRLVELEGGDIASLGETSTLGGDTGGGQAVTGGGSAAPVTDPGTGTQLAVGEEDDFKSAQQALADGNYQAAADQFAAFSQNYPGGPLAAGADLGRGEALDALGNTREAARAYLSSFGAAPTGPLAAQALFRLGRSLGQLEQTSEACVTLGEVPIRFPEDPAAGEAQAEMQRLGCG